MAETIKDEGTRACGYSRCDRRIAYSGAGRPREYCGPPDRVWPDMGGRTCKQLAAEERQAARNAGLETVLAGYAATEDPVLTAITALSEVLADRTTAGERVLEAVGGRLAEAERMAAEAVARAAQAETERDRAARAAAAADREKDQAVEARRVAER